jgi:hypothetical protein
MLALPPDGFSDPTQEVEGGIMYKTITGLLGAVATLGVAQAAPTPDTNDALKANSFAELLEPIPNATAVLNAMDEKSATENNVQLAYHHHHHHHHHQWRRRHHHHHHHHHWR